MYITELEDREFKIFKGLIYSETGIKLSDMKKALVQARLAKRIRSLGLFSYAEYHDYLINNYEIEKVNFINSITTNKTEFFREIKHFEYLKTTYLPELEEKKLKELRIWSAGCSTGEEPYSIAITLLEYFKNRKMPEIKILATDIDTSVLESAREGIYREDQLNEVGKNDLRGYFYRGRGENFGLYKAKENMKDIIYFRRSNLKEKVYPMKKKFQIIFCRNVIIYFDRETQKDIFSKFYNYLADDGRLFIGHAENIMNIVKNFTLIKNTIYKKVL